MPYNNCELAICKFRNGGRNGKGAKCLAFHSLITLRRLDMRFPSRYFGIESPIISTVLG